MLGMIAYFAGVTRAPLTAVIIVMEMTADRAMILPLFAAALVADHVSAQVCPEKLYHTLSHPFRVHPHHPAPKPAAQTPRHRQLPLRTDARFFSFLLHRPVPMAGG
jgi:H+/Cl- antiporter ClcA